MAECGEAADRTASPRKMCSPSNLKEHLNEAKNFCTECDALFCHKCSEQHDLLLSDHPIQEIVSDEVDVAISMPTEVCDDHAELVKFYCKEHGVICCSSCIALDHTSCDEVHYRATSTADLCQTDELNKETKQFSDIINKLESIKLSQQDTQSSLDDSRQNCLDDVDDYRADLLNLVEKLVLASKEDIERKYSAFTTDLQRHSQNVERCLNDLIVAKDRLDNNHENDAQRFVELKKSQNNIEPSTTVIDGATGNMRIKGFDVSIDNTLEKAPIEVKSLATTLEPTQIKQTRVTNVSYKEDNTTCDRVSTCVLNDGSVPLADFENNRLKLLSSKTLSITEQCSLESFPWGVRCINDDEAVVTQKRGLVFVSLKRCLKPTRTLTMTHDCYNVAYSNTELFVTDWYNTLYVYTIQGTLLRTVISDPSGHDIFSECRHITFSGSAEKVYVTDYGKGLITLDRQGSVLDTRLYSEVRGKLGVCPDGLGGLFICGMGSSNVVHLGRRGNVLSEVVSRSDGLVEPNSVSYDCQNRMLYVSQLDNNNLLVFYL